MIVATEEADKIFKLAARFTMPIMLSSITMPLNVLTTLMMDHKPINNTDQSA